MPPRKKDFLKPNPKAKAKATEPQTENDFLEAADEMEQSAGKWRAGDPAKAVRFFNRAIDAYNAGLSKYPNSFDLAYNKANLEYNMTEDVRIVSVLGNKIALLEETLQSHRRAVALGPDNMDASFNTGQVLTSLAEALLESETQVAAKVSSRSLLEEAVDLFTKCLASQQHEYEETQAQITEALAAQQSEDDFIPEEQASVGPLEDGSVEGAGEWATVIEPVTPESMLETCTAQLEALTTLLGLYDLAELQSVEWRAEVGFDTANNKVPVLIQLLEKMPASAEEDSKAGPTLSISPGEDSKTAPKDDAILAVANFKASTSEAAYRSNGSTAVTYATEIETIFRPLIDKATTGNSGLALVNIMSAYSDALTDLASAIADRRQHDLSSPNLPEDLQIQWTALTEVQARLAQVSSGTYASTLSPGRLADIFLARGDADMFRFRLSLSALAKPAWIRSKMVLISNAGVFYRGARSYAEKAAAAEIQKTAEAKSIVAEVLKEASNGSAGKKGYEKEKATRTIRVLEQMMEEGLVSKDDAEIIVKLLQ
ncbi:hypothetical protein EJ04DRAFT_509582 [Polyplosphaeria fusca]|uniref:Uncharacterized protein n=1 Tax=Polyplosphaeria fusca TaxID=682080 RepID=A0A9P4V549_9PLEO|nr:hypothetical protein EJ04DRAFT_509582 [Polyplosphaeria fusca]